MEVRFHPFINLALDGGGQLHTPAALFPERALPVPIKWEVDWTAEPVWTFCRRENFLARAEGRCQ